MTLARVWRRGFFFGVNDVIPNVLNVSEIADGFLVTDISRIGIWRSLGNCRNNCCVPRYKFFNIVDIGIRK